MTGDGDVDDGEPAATPSGPADDALARAQTEHAQVHADWMSIPGVTGVQVGLLREDDLAPRPGTVGLIVFATPDRVQSVQALLPSDRDGVPVQVIPGEAGLQAGPH